MGNKFPPRLRGCPPDRPADLVLAMLSVPQQAEGCMVVISEQNIRRKRFPELGND